jgi:hypothetical protein
MRSEKRKSDSAPLAPLLEALRDLARWLQGWVGEFASALDTPDLLSDLEAILSRKH